MKGEHVGYFPYIRSGSPTSSGPTAYTTEPTQSPSKEPTRIPTIDPSTSPSSDPTTSPSPDPTEDCESDVDYEVTMEECGDTAFISNAAECELAACTLGLPFNDCCQNNNNLPYGCVKRMDGDVLFNGNAATSSGFGSNRWAVCVMCMYIYSF